MKTLSIYVGGTGAGNAADARINLGANSFSIKDSSTLTKVSNYTVVSTDNGKLLLANSESLSSFTITLPVASSVGEGFTIGCKKVDSSANTVTIDGNGSETIDNSLTSILDTAYQVEWYRSDGSNWWKETSISTSASATSGNIQIFTSNGTWTKKTGISYVLVELWAGGGGGGTGVNGSRNGGGGGGAYTKSLFASADLATTENVIVGVGGAGGTSSDGEVGQDSWFGGDQTSATALVTAYGGGGGSGSPSFALQKPGGGGGGTFSKGITGGSGGHPNSDTSTAGGYNPGYGGGNGGSATPGGYSGMGGGGGGAGDSFQGGDSVYGGAGGGGGDTTTAGSGGTSIFGGNGGDGAIDVNAASSGSVPGGGGGGAEEGNGGDGGAGQVIITQW